MPIQFINTALRKIPTWLLYVLLPVPGLMAIWAGITGDLGPEPIKALEQALGEFALKLLIVGLAVKPLLHFTRINLVRFRRATGVVTFGYVVAHFLTWFLLDVQLLSQIWADIVKRPYITIGFSAFVIMVPLALTSNNWSVRKLGHFWRVLHRLTYVVAILGALHYLMLVKGFQIEPLVHMAIIFALLAARVPQLRRFIQISLRSLGDKILKRQ